MNEGMEDLSSVGKLLGDYITAVKCFDEKTIHKSLRVLRSAVTTTIAPETVFSEEETEQIFSPLYKFILDIDPRRGNESRHHLQSNHSQSPSGGTAVSLPLPPSSSSSSTHSPSIADRDTKGANPPSSPALLDEFQNRIWAGISSAFSDKHIVLGTAYHSLSLQLLALAKKSVTPGRWQEAIEYAGRALLVALNAHGVVADSTAERHCYLGSLYVHTGQYDLARKQLSIGKEIYRRIYGSVSLEVAQCDCDLAHVESAAGAGRQRRAYAYNAWYDCYRARSLLLGAADSNALTMEALDQLLHLRQLELCPGGGGAAGVGAGTGTETILSADVCVSPFELLQAVDDLHWERLAAKSPRFQVSIFVHQLIAAQQSRDQRVDASAMSGGKITQLVTSAVRFAHSHIGTGTESRKVQQTTPNHMHSITGSGSGIGMGVGVGSPASPSAGTAAAAAAAAAAAEAHSQQEVSQIVEELVRACRGSAVLVPPLNRAYDYIAPTRPASPFTTSSSSSSAVKARSPNASSAAAASSSSSPLFRSPASRRSNSPGVGIGIGIGIGVYASTSGSPGSGSSSDDIQRKAQRNGALSEAGSPFYKGKELAQLRAATGANQYQPRSVEAGVRGRPLQADGRPVSQRLGALRAGGTPEAKNTTGPLSLDLLTLAMMTPTVPASAAAAAAAAAAALSPSADADASNAGGARPKSVRFPAGADLGGSPSSSLSSPEGRPKSVRMLASAASPTASASASAGQSPEGSRAAASAGQQQQQMRDADPITQRIREELHRAAAQLTSTGVEGVEEAQVPFSLGGRLSVLARDSDNNAVVVTSLLAAANAVKAGKMTFAMATHSAAAAAPAFTSADGKSGGSSSSLAGGAASNQPELSASALRRASDTVRRMSKKLSAAELEALHKEEEEAHALALSSSSSSSSPIPQPPPLPSAWPPVPYKGPHISIEEALLFGKPDARPSAANAANAGASSGAGGGGGGDGHGAKTGEPKAPVPVGAFAAAKAAAAASAKGAKKIELSPLVPHSGSAGNVAANDQFFKGTLWEVDVPEHVPLSHIFDDIEDEFLKLPKRKSDAGKAKGAGAGKNAAALGGKSIRPSHDTSATTDAGAKGSAAAAVGSVLDPRRNQNLSIMLTKFGKRTAEDISKSVLDFDCEAVGIAALQTLSENIPAPEEYKAVKALIASLAAKQAEADKAQAAHDEEFSAAVTAAAPASGLTGAALALSRIGKAEKYIFYLGAIPSLEGRLQSMLQCLTAVEAGETCHRAGESINIATNEVLDSDRLRYFLNLVLRMTNVVNCRSVAALQAGVKNSHSSPPPSQVGKGGAGAGTEVAGTGTGPIRGFKLSEISNLAKTKTNSGDTADVYLVHKIYINLPQALDIGADLAQIDAAKDVNFPRIRADVAKLTDGVAALERLIAAEEKRPEKEKEEGTGRALILMNQRLAESKALASTCVKELREAESDFSRVCLYLGEDPAQATPAAVFGALKRLVLTVQEATRTVQDKVAKAERLARRQGGGKA